MAAAGALPREGKRVVELVVLVRGQFEVFFIGQSVVFFFHFCLPLLLSLRRGGDGARGVTVADVVVLADEVVEGELHQSVFTSRFQWCCSRMLAASDGS